MSVVATPGYDAEPPPVWLWYRIFAVTMGLLNGLVGSALVLLLVATRGQGMNDEDLITFGIAIVSCFPLSVAYLAAPFLPRAKWAWMYHMVAICIPMSSPCCLPIGIPLVVYWVKPETKAFFGKLD